MNFETKVKQSLKEKSKHITPPQELKQKVMNKIENIDGVSKVKKRIVAGFIAVALIIPTAAAAYQAYLADDLYGSFENVKKHFAAATIDSYMLLNAKLEQAKGELGKEEFGQFYEQLKVITGSKVEYGDQYGNIDFDMIPQNKVQEIKNALMVLQPFFDKLNGHESSKAILSPQEYEIYIDAIMTYQKILVKSGINPSNSFLDEDIKPGLLEEFIAARTIMADVDKRVINVTNEPLFPIPTFTINNQNIDVYYGIPSHSGSEINFNNSEVFIGYAKLLSPIEVMPNSILNITFDNEPDIIEFQIMDKQGEIYSQGTLETLQLPDAKGEYLIVVLGQWDNVNVPYVFVTKVED
ncbi:DUF3600 domain-containing protein [Anaerobacillus isosaccharinicus]|uniref:DUF3600 domain-containing protein n=1 Tax=Anaerobacillus isosaccharinicus TaxID=1532552 RepID=A0A1S2LJ07_9BACI|nr:DUF3600 domain-containing protein [Anaerobacillus isosaccharinicus]MBA5587068.1 DUF3600 domain-containing protein [Anaerobacillus isosaccharinicus]QOY34735.1 DUF3600 domain-containing protein [Anaerobacillus isosaccharinicus]